VLLNMLKVVWHILLCTNPHGACGVKLWSVESGRRLAPFDQVGLCLEQERSTPSSAKLFDRQLHASYSLLESLVLQEQLH
jgi:hypothetical protein